jgi:hypothetical protein
MSIVTLLELVKTLQQKRVAAAESAGKLRQARAAWEQEHRAEIELLNTQKEEVEEADEALRLRAVEAYNESGQKDKHPAAGVDIRLEKQVLYEEARALQWCVAKGVCLKLDSLAFEAMVKNTETPDPGLNFVTVMDVPMASIKSDLSKYIGA